MAETPSPLTWDIFCHVIDNFGDIGVCWRLSVDLASRGHAVRLWVDDASALSWMAPQALTTMSAVQVLVWDAAARAEPADIVIEAFGCELPNAFLQRMAWRADAAPVWINLEYLSAESEVERNHGLRSPQLSGPGAGMCKWFFYPGFTARTGGLLRERDLADRQQRFDAAAWLSRLGVVRRAGERLASLFCYDNRATPDLLDLLAEEPTCLLTAPGAATRQVQQALATRPSSRLLRVLAFEPLTQHDFDHLLWSCDINFVRGEDSFVRAQWAGKPFVWQLYPQHDGVHATKLGAFLDRFNSHVGDAERARMNALWRWWNGLTAKAAQRPTLPSPVHWQTACQDWRRHLMEQTDLATQLIGFASERR